MPERHFLSATRIENMVEIAFSLSGQQVTHFSVTIPERNANRLVAGTIEALRPSPHAPFIRTVLGIRQVPPADATQPNDLMIVCETTVGRLELPISRTGAMELEAALHSIPLTRGYP